MREKLKFTEIKSSDKDEFYRLMQAYARELDKHQNRRTDSEALRKWTYRIVEKQSDKSRPIYLKFALVGETVIGFFYGDVDKSADKGFVKDGYGRILEFYVLAEFRRLGYGKEMFLYLEDAFRSDGIEMLCLTADPVTGKPFWEALGFICTGKIYPDNNLMIYEKSI